MPEKIMVVDDETDLEFLIKQKFRKQIKEKEYEFVFAYNGLDALSKLLEHPDIGIILSDINMPEMDGLTLLAKLNELRNPALRTVIVSAYGDMDNIRTAMNRGAFDFITKPVDFNDLELTIQKTIHELNIIREAIKEHDQLVQIKHDLKVASEIQQSILPKNFPPFPGKKEFDIYATMHAAKDVGGDFYDFFLIDEDRLGFVIADVSGKGIPAAIFMAVSRTLLRAVAMKGLPPEECLTYTNNLLYAESVASMFVTLFYGILDIRTGVVTYANGGHNPPYKISTDGKVTALELTDGIALGVWEGFQYKSKNFKLNPGEKIFLYTDGVTEAFNIKDELFSEEKLEAKLYEYFNYDVTNLVKKIVDEVFEHSKGVEQSDDITTLCFQFNG